MFLYVICIWYYEKVNEAVIKKVNSKTKNVIEINMDELLAII